MSGAPPTEEQLAFAHKLVRLIEQGHIPIEVLEEASAKGAKLMLITEEREGQLTRYQVEVMDSIN